ncbi:MAG: hypothetical protein O3B24_05670 [Verrucomicrobia bacterium]|nr:hypothetical protein [Verrucomicrobiota bacterium]
MHARLIILVVVLLAVVTAIISWRLHHTPTARVTKRFNALAALISMPQPESPIQMAVKGQNLQGFFTASAELHTPVLGAAGPMSPADIASLTMAARASFRDMRFSFRDLTITFPAPRVATATVTARIEGSMTSGERVDEIRELHCELQHVEHVWRFSACAVVDVLQR